MKIDYAMYRNFSTENRNEPRIGFIDGNVLEMILDLPRGLMAQIETKIGKGNIVARKIKNKITKFYQESPRSRKLWKL